MFNSVRAKVLYSKRYPIPFQDVNLSELISDCMTTKEEDTRFEEIMNSVYYDQKFVPRPDRMEGKEKFIALAKTLSDAYQVDLDITQYLSYIKARFFFYCGPNDRKLTQMLAELFRMSDQSDFSLFSDEPTDFAISFDFVTHDLYAGDNRANDV